MQTPKDAAGPSARATPDEVAAFLRTVPLFERASADALTALARNGRVQRLAKGSTVFEFGDRATSMYVVWRGEITEYVPGPSGMQLPGKVRRPGDYFGEIGVATSGSHVVREVARTDAALVVIPGAEFMAQVRACPEVAVGLIEVLARRLVQAGGRIVTMARLDAEAQLAEYLLWLDREEGDHGAVAVSQEAIADACGLARQTVARVIARWRNAGLVTTGRGELQLPGRDELRAIVASREP